MNLSDVLEFVGNKPFCDVVATAAENDLVIKQGGEELVDLYLLVVNKDKDSSKNLTPLQKQSNGLILEKDTNHIVCACQPKIIDVGMEDLPMVLKDGVRTRLEYCEDGTVMRLYCRGGVWYTATTRCVDARKSYWSSDKTFDDLFWDVFDRSMLDGLDKNSTYIFVLLHKENRIVVRHNINMLIFVCRVDNVSLVEYYHNVFPNVRNIRRPKQAVGETVETLNMERCYHPMKRGIVVKVLHGAKGGWSAYKIDFAKYKEIKEIRGNVPHIRMRFLELLKDEDSLKQLEENYVEHQRLFNLIRQSLRKQVKTIHKLYIDSHVKHLKTVTEDDVYFRTLKQLHAQYKKTNKPITFEDVHDRINHLDKNVLKKFLGWV